MSLDPLMKKYPNESNYAYCSNNPIYYVDKEGKKKITYIETIDEKGNKSYVTKINEKAVRNIRVITTLFGYSTGGYNDVDFDLVEFVRVDAKTGKTYSTGEIVTERTKSLFDNAIENFSDAMEKMKGKESDREGGLGLTSKDFTANEEKFFAKAKYREDAIDIEALLGARGGAEVGSSIKLFGEIGKLKEALVKIGIAKNVFSNGLDLGGQAVGLIEEIQKIIPKPVILDKGADSCECCHKVSEKGTMKPSKHIGITETKTKQKKTTSQ
jgi:hypothetical protein